jgi:Amt family ammonium transporter
MSLDMSSMKKILPVLLICLLMLAGGTALYVPDVAAQAPAAEAAPAPLKADPGDTAWLLTSSALVMLMTLPGLALFYGGLTRAKNMLSTLMHCFITLCLSALMWEGSSGVLHG